MCKPQVEIQNYMSNLPNKMPWKMHSDAARQGSLSYGNVTCVLFDRTKFSVEMPGAKKPPTAKSNMSAREMWLQAVKGRSSTLGANNRKGGLSSTKKTPNEYWVGSLRRSQGRFSIHHRPC